MMGGNKQQLGAPEKELLLRAWRLRPPLAQRRSPAKQGSWWWPFFSCCRSGHPTRRGPARCSWRVSPTHHQIVDAPLARLGSRRRLRRPPPPVACCRQPPALTDTAVVGRKIRHASTTTALRHGPQQSLAVALWGSCTDTHHSLHSGVRMADRSFHSEANNSIAVPAGVAVVGVRAFICLRSNDTSHGR